MLTAGENAVLRGPDDSFEDVEMVEIGNPGEAGLGGKLNDILVDGKECRTLAHQLFFMFGLDLRRLVYLGAHIY